MWYLAWKGALGFKFRTALTLLGVALGTFALTAMGAMSLHFHKMAKRFEASIGEKLLIREKTGFFGAGAIDEKELSGASREQGISEIIPAVVARLKAGEILVLGMPEIVLGIPMGKISFLFHDVPLMQGRWPESPDECVLGANLSEKNRGKTTFMFQGKSLRVSGSMARTDGQEDGEAVLSISTLQAILGRNGIVSYGIVIPSPGVDSKELGRRLESGHPYWEVIPSEVLFRAIRKNEILWNALTAGTGLLAVLVGGIEILLITMMSVQERIQEVAVARTMGASRVQIFQAYLCQASLMAFIGTLLGFLAGLFFVKAANRHLIHEGIVLFEIAPSLIGYNLVLAVFLSLFGGIYPAVYGSRVRVAEALRW